MSFAVEVSVTFKREARRLQKRYRSLPDDIAGFVQRLEKDPIQGSALGQGCYKVRLAIRSKGQGKSGGARVITCIVVVDAKVYLLSIFDKSEQATLNDKRLQDLLDESGLI